MRKRYVRMDTTSHLSAQPVLVGGLPAGLSWTSQTLWQAPAKAPTLFPFKKWCLSAEFPCINIYMFDMFVKEDFEGGDADFPLRPEGRSPQSAKYCWWHTDPGLPA